MTGSPAVSVVIVNFNTRDATIECLESLLEDTRTVPGGVEIVVVDNGSVDGSVPAIRRLRDEIVVVEAGKNLGFARGVNEGVRRATGDQVVLLNPDTIVLPGAIRALLDFATRHPEHRLYGGRTLRPDGGVDPSSCWGAPSLWSLICFATGLSTAFPRSRIFDPESLGRWDRDTVREVPVITGCLLMTSRADWDLLGGMDEQYFLYGEDADFSARARKRGFRPVVVPAAEIVHAVGGSTAASGLKMCMVMAGKATYFRDRWGGAGGRVAITLLQAGSLLRATLEAVSGRSNATWRTVWRRRRDWRAGYPRARMTIFGLPLTSD